jgi:hypothetical protein
MTTEPEQSSGKHRMPAAVVAVTIYDGKNESIYSWPEMALLLRSNYWTPHYFVFGSIRDLGIDRFNTVPSLIAMVTLVVIVMSPFSVSCDRQICSSVRSLSTT